MSILFYTNEAFNGDLFWLLIKEGKSPHIDRG